MTSFDILVYNKIADKVHYQYKRYETGDIEKAKELFKEDPQYWRYELIDVEIHVPVERVWYDGDFSSNKTFKMTTLV
jgi:hypothetical protein